MAKYQKLTDQQVTDALGHLPEWTVSGQKLYRQYRFPDFSHAFGFMATAATYIQARDHHPEWCNVYGTVTVSLTTHDVGGITNADVELAALLENLATKLQ